MATSKSIPKERVAILKFKRKSAAEALSDKLSALGIPHIFAEVGPGDAQAARIMEHSGPVGYDDSWPTLGFCIHVPGKTIKEVKRINRYDQAAVNEVADHIRGQAKLPLEGGG
ncbi:MAG: hypothetical protein F4X17_14955 [Gemmatimonadetes bacterium]|nr:hypothetical protein [Gemmatimonadota bacterium]